MWEKFKENFLEKFIETFFGLFIACLSLAIAAIIVQMSWFLSVADIFKLSTLTFWQAAALVILCRTLVGATGEKEKEET